MNPDPLATRSPLRSLLAAFLRRETPLRAANDNVHGFSNDMLLRAALRHFAEHGLSAAEQARCNAERAFFAGDRANYDWWLEICRTLDRRMAVAVASRRSVG